IKGQDTLHKLCCLIELQSSRIANRPRNRNIVHQTKKDARSRPKLDQENQNT
ncbi:hypothetical protein FRB90_003577, partial [Tulasnella sp. 427]